MLNQAKHLIENGFSVIPVNEKKQPMVAFKRSGYTQNLPGNELDLLYTQSHGIAIIAGEVSGNLICIDVDLKYDITGDLMSRLKIRLEEVIPDFFKRIVLQQTRTNGFHLIFRVEHGTKVGGNKKLAMRSTNEAELEEDRKNNPKLKKSERVLIETRGEGGYFLIAPTPGYKIIKNTFASIGTFTPDELDAVFATCRSFNELEIAEVVYDIQDRKIMSVTSSIEVSPWDDYNNRTDGVALLESYGWEVTGQINSTTLKLLRPGKPSKEEHSAYYHTDSGKLVVFSTSTPFDTERNGTSPAYTPFAIYAVYEHNGNIKEAARMLSEHGFGSNKFKQESYRPEVVLRPKDMPEHRTKPSDPEEPSRMEDPDNKDSDVSKFIGDFNNAVGYLNMARSNSLPEGLKFGYEKLDNHWRLKKGALVIVHGLANVGKSTFMWYIAILSAMAHGWRWVIYTGENDYEFVIRRMMETYSGKSLHTLTQDEWDIAEIFVRTHFVFITNDFTYSYKDLLGIVEKLMEEQHFDAIMVDPYNSLVVDDTIAKQIKILAGNKHDYDYMVTTELRVFCRKTGLSVYLNVHTGTEGARRVAKDPSKPPKMYEVEGGNKFAARADDFITIHRNTKDESSWMITEVHIDKIKTQETGGRPTAEDRPITLRFLPEMGRFMGSTLGTSHTFDPINQYKKGKHAYPSSTPEPINLHPEITPEDYVKPNTPGLLSARESYFTSNVSDDDAPF
jgi:hypothetical protein